MMEANRPSTAEEEALKKNTDCIYFLASPFTCKKGNECEFRHSEGARVNPRDCWYWLNGNCLNPKCAFRHPPLDGLYGIPAPPGSLPSSLQAVVNVPGAYNTNKQSVPCIFFQRGQCLKGDMCSFMHGPHPASNRVTDQSTNGPHQAANSDPHQLTNGSHLVGNNVVQQAAKVSPSLTGTSQMISWGLKECNASKKAEGPVKGQLRNRSLSPYPVDYERPRFQPTIAPVSSENSPTMSSHHPLQPAEGHYSNGREADDLLGESSPGFDVLVDDEEDYLRDSEYYHNEQSINDFDYQQPDYEHVPSFQRDQYNGKGEHDRDYHRVSSEWAMERISNRRPMHRESSPDEIEGLDLRHRLLKKRRVSGLRSTIGTVHHSETRNRDDHLVDDRYRGRSSGRGRDQLSSFSSRFQGRITLPPRSPPIQSFDSHSDRDRRRMHGRSSPSRKINYKGRPHDRIKRTPNEESSGNGRRFRYRPERRDDGNPLSFAGPKSLAELKGAMVSGTSREQAAKSMNAPLSAGYQASEDSLSFEGPKPLSDILKRKRQNTPENEINGRIAEERDYNGDRNELNGRKAEESDYNDNSAENPETQIIEEEKEDRESQYKEIGGEDLNMEDEDNAYPEDEDKYHGDETAYQEDEDDEDEFAKKVGAFFS
ncbi:zinc finger CCCH domain-containing protein 32 [Asparagus officinalis]|nr:zinc finger CCCH domain-containing protein 32 [Asparagus officinalis]